MNSTDAPISERDNLLVFLLQYILLVDSIAAKCCASNGNRKAIICAVYTGSVIKDVKSILFLVEHRCSFSVPKVLRSVIESVVNIKAVMEDESYSDYLVFESLYQKRKNVVRFRELAKTREFRDRISVERESIEFLDNELTKYPKWEIPYTIERKFQIAKMQYVYDSAYSNLSEDVHARLFSLANSFQNSGGVGPLLSVNNECDDETLAGWVEVAAMAMVEAVECLSTACNHDTGLELQTLKWNIIQFQRIHFPDHCPAHYKEYPE